MLASVAVGGGVLRGHVGERTDTTGVFRGHLRQSLGVVGAGLKPAATRSEKRRQDAPETVSNAA